MRETEWLVRADPGVMLEFVYVGPNDQAALGRPLHRAPIDALDTAHGRSISADHPASRATTPHQPPPC
jgi:hypothetical protein